jgi:hypothetical protein
MPTHTKFLIEFTSITLAHPHMAAASQTSAGKPEDRLAMHAATDGNR